MNEPFLPRRLTKEAAILFAMFSLFLAGCGANKPDVPFGAVSGRVTWNGQPLSDALVAFEPDRGRGSYARTNAAGEYRLSYRGQPWGAVVGKHVVRISTEKLLNDAEEHDGAEPKISREILPRQFNRASSLTATVTDGENVINFDLIAK